jgi:hypothetical protein
MFGEQSSQEEPSPFGRGCEDALGVDMQSLLAISSGRMALLRARLDAPDAWISLLSYEDEAARKAGITSTDLVARTAIRDYEKRRVTWADAVADVTRRAYAVVLTKTFWPQLQASLGQVGRTIDEFGNAGPERLMEFWESIPSLLVEMELHTQMQRQASKRWTTHDNRDIGFLSLAIPACDIVVTEAFWADLAQRRKLDNRYGTMVISDLNDLPKYLR